MSEISNIRPWTHVHATTGETEYFIDVHFEHVIASDEWQFGTNKTMWEAVVAIIERTKSNSKYVNTGACNGCGQEIYLIKP